MLCLDPPMIWESLIYGPFLWALAMGWHRWWAGRLRSLVPFPLLTTVPHWRAASLFLAPDAGPGPRPRLGNGLSWRVTCFCKSIFFFLLFYLDLLSMSMAVFVVLVRVFVAVVGIVLCCNFCCSCRIYCYWCCCCCCWKILMGSGRVQHHGSHVLIGHNHGFWKSSSSKKFEAHDFKQAVSALASLTKLSTCPNVSARCMVQELVTWLSSMPLPMFQVKECQSIKGAVVLAGWEGCQHGGELRTIFYWKSGRAQSSLRDSTDFRRLFGTVSPSYFIWWVLWRKGQRSSNFRHSKFLAVAECREWEARLKLFARLAQRCWVCYIWWDDVYSMMLFDPFIISGPLNDVLWSFVGQIHDPPTTPSEWCQASHETTEALRPVHPDLHWLVQWLSNLEVMG